MLLRRYIVYILVLIPCFGRSQNSSFLFHHFTEKDGLSSNYVTCLLKDKRGVLWLGTYDGLNWFDGAHFYNFKKTKQSSSIINNVIHDLCEDAEGNIWGATDNGIFCYDITQNIFRNYQAPISKIAPSLTNVARGVNNVLCDSKGRIWATGTWTILKFNAAEKKFEEIGPLSPVSDSLDNYSVRRNGLIEDPGKKGLWFTTREEGLVYYDYNSGTFTSFKNDADSLFRKRSVSSITVSGSGACWFCDNTNQQIIRFDPSTRKEIMKIDLAGKVSAGVCSTLFEDSQNRLWYGNWNSEIALVEFEQGATVTRIKNEKSNHLSIAADFLAGVLEDKDGTVWLATTGGLSNTNSTKSIYRIHWLDRIPILKNNSLRLVLEDPADKSWWMATRGPLYAIHYFPVTGKYIIYDLQQAQKNVIGLLPGPVNNIRFIDGKPVLCTWWGAWQIDVAANRIFPFSPGPAVDPKFIIGDMVERDGVFYLSNQNEMLRYVRSENKLDRLKFVNPKLPDGQRPAIKALCLTPDNNLWFIAGFGWLGHNNGNNELAPFYVVKNEDEELNGWLNSIACDRNSNLWLAAFGIGLYGVFTSSDSAKLWNETDGLIYNHVQNVIPDDNGDIWCAAYNRFSVFTPATGSFYNFIVPLSENTVEYENGLGQLSNGHIVASLDNNVVEFFPGRLKIKPILAKPIIGAVNIAGSQRFLNGDTTLQLQPDEKFLSLNFGLMTDREIFPYQLEYRLKGFDDKWSVAGAGNQAVYSKLPSGNYTFEVKAKAINGDWETPVSTLKIQIKTPFYRSAWFISVVACIVCALLFFFYRFRIAKQKQVFALETKAQLLEKEKALVMYEGLKQQLNPHFLFNSLTSLSSLITVDPQTATQFLDSLSKTYRYILKSRDAETVPLSDELKSAENYVNIQQTRFERGFCVRITVPDESLHKKIVPVTLQNMIENAIKHNIIDEDSPLVVEIFVENGYIVVRNNLQKKKFVETSNKQGLTNLQSLYRYLTSHPVEIISDENFFTIKIPLV
ncbi:MAG TPA: histidine kinase [Parafilimonas sp.]|nr:histidine kinase [Parafilimonas sp.]